MSKKLLAIALTILTVIIFVAPISLFIAPQRVSASDWSEGVSVSGSSSVGGASCAGGAIGGLFGIIGAAFNLGGAAVPTNSNAANTNEGSILGTTAGQCIYEIVLKPLARAMIRMALQQITAGIINWINGGNGTGQPSFVLNLSVHLQSVGDAVALPFITTVRTAMNPTFGASIASSLLRKYAQQTSVGGFLAANQSTFARVSPNPDAFLAGNFSQGSIPAWFSLTTKSNNNPFMIADASENQLNNLVNQAKVNRRQDLNQSGGYLSWCGVNQTTTEDNDGTAMELGVNPGVSCIKDGKEGNVQTPGTVIRDFTKKAVVDSGMDQLINPQDLDVAFSAIVTALFRNVLGGTGLFGSSQTTGAQSSAITSQLNNTATDNSSAMTAANTVADAAIARVNNSNIAWNTIATAANSAFQAATSLKNTCTSQATNAQAAIAQATQVINQTQTVSSATSDTHVAALNLKQEAATVTTTNVTAMNKLTADTQTLSTMPPTAADVTYAQNQANAYDGATASPEGSLNVSGGSLVDQMNLISKNAQALNASCVTS